MRERGIAILVTVGLLAILSGSGAMAAEANPSLSTRELIESLTRIENRIENLQVQINGLQRQIDDNQKSLQRQIDDNQKHLQRQIDDNQKSLQRQFDELRGFVIWGFGIMIMGMFALVTFVVWDRRTALSPTMNQVDDLRHRERDIEDVLRKYAFQDPRLAEILKASGLL